MSKITIEGISSCGVPCFACPSFNKTCKGCRSDDKQKRKSKLGCKIRICSLSEKKVQFCSECGEFPCKIVVKKLQTTHQDEKKYAYRYEVQENLRILQEFGIEKGLEKLDARWRCGCGGRIHFYHYTCNKCGKSYLDNMPDIR